MTSTAWDRSQIVDLLNALAGELDRKGVRAELFVVGGAAMALAFDTRRVTRDVDAVFEPKAEVYAAARHVAEDRGLPPDWLNDAVKGLLPGPDPAALPVLDLPGLRVSAPSARYLLALKVAAARVDRDADDIRVLARICGLGTAEEVLTLTEEIVGGRRLLPKVQFLVEEMFANGGPSNATSGAPLGHP